MRGGEVREGEDSMECVRDTGIVATLCLFGMYTNPNKKETY